MSKVLKYILFRTALIIITLHTIIPHPHSDELTVDKHLKLHKDSNSIIGIIRLAFHESDDENLDNLIFAQYENVKKLDNKCKYPKLSILKKIQFKSKKREKEKKVKWNANNFDRLLFVKLNRLRGPPLIT